MAARSRAPQLSQSRSIRDRRVPRSGQPIANGEETKGQKKRKRKKKKRTCLYRGYVAVGGGVMQLHGGCRFAPGASAARAEPLHVLVLSGRAAVPGHGECGTAKRAGGGGAPSASWRLALARREPAASGVVP